MTRNEKKDTHSEITPKISQNLDTGLWDLNMEIHYTLLQGANPDSFRSPLDGYAHIILVEGCWSGTYQLDNQSYIIRCCENAIHPVKKGSTLAWKNVSDETIAILIFSSKGPVSQLLERLGYKQAQLRHGLIAKNSQQLSLIAQRLHTLSTEVDPFLKLRIQILALEALLCQLREHYSGNSRSSAVNGKNYYEKVQEVKRLIEQDLSKNYTISELAKEVGTNEQYIKKYFKQYFGKTVMNYVTSTKMEYAKRLIMTGEYRISDVAQMIGYKHSTHFTTAFKKYFGFIPNSLRFAFWGASFALLENSAELLPLMLY